MSKLIKPKDMPDDMFNAIKRMYDKAPKETVERTSEEVAKDAAEYVRKKRRGM